jgi:hypothetical protein
MLIVKGTLPGAAPTGQIAHWENFAAAVCDDSQSLTENYPIASAQKCFKWRIILDSDKLFTWATGAQRNTNAAANLLLRMYAIATGMGTHNSDGAGAYEEITGRALNKDFVSNVFIGTLANGGTREDSWAHNFATRGFDDGNNTLTCVP